MKIPAKVANHVMFILRCQKKLAHRCLLTTISIMNHAKINIAIPRFYIENKLMIQVILTIFLLLAKSDINKPLDRFIVPT